MYDSAHTQQSLKLDTRDEKKKRLHHVLITKLLSNLRFGTIAGRFNLHIIINELIRFLYVYVLR